MPYLILVRHGESRWNMSNRFTGWVDVPLSETGIYEALIAAEHLEGLTLDVAFTSKLERAQETLLLILAKQDYTARFVHDQGKEKSWSHHFTGKEKKEIPVYTNTALNERYYGDLQGMNKDEARKRWGKDKVFEWRRSWDVRPPRGESLKDVYARSVPYFRKTILPQLKKGKDVIVSAHGNSLRAIIKHLDGISDEKIPLLELPMGKPFVYKYARGKLVKENWVHSFDRPTYWQIPSKSEHARIRGE
jgi:2,3-bisphosphoglycerate-dependent phosphoglycerate mutase